MTPGYDALGSITTRRTSGLIVPKRNPALGWTINLSHPYGALLLIAMLAAAIVPLSLAFMVHPLHRG